MNPPADRKIVHTILAFALLGLFAISAITPYFKSFPTGEGGNLIVSHAETIKNLMILVVGYYFGSTATNSKRNDMLTEKALAPSDPPAPGTARVEAAANVDATLSVDAKPAADEPKP